MSGGGAENGAGRRPLAGGSGRVAQDEGGSQEREGRAIADREPTRGPADGSMKDAFDGAGLSAEGPGFSPVDRARLRPANGEDINPGHTVGRGPGGSTDDHGDNSSAEIVPSADASTARTDALSDAPTPAPSAAYPDATVAPTSRLPPKPAAAEGRGSVLGYARRFRRDLLSALPARLYRAWMADFRSPLIRSVVCNDPALVRLVLAERPGDFPKSDRLREGLAPLLGQSVFVTNGALWERQRRIIDPAFEGGRLRETFPAILAASLAALQRIAARACTGEIDIEPETSHAAADVIFRTLFSLPIEHRTASEVFAAFRAHQDAQPIVNLAALVPLPAWLPRWHGRRTRRTARRIRGLIEDMVADRAIAIAEGRAPDDLATKIMITPDPQTGQRFSPAEMVDQVAIFFLAGHETSASALAWALWLLADNPDWQARVAAEARAVLPDDAPDFGAVARLKTARAVFREAMRLYPPVPMMVRETIRTEHFRDRDLPRGTQVVISPWHLHRHERLWDDPDGFDPGRWDTESGRTSARAAYIPFSAGQRVCPGAGFAMIEGPLLLALICRDLVLAPGAEPPVPVARLTVRGKDGIRLRLSRR